MAGPRADIHIEGLVWSESVIAKVHDKHSLEPDEAETILDSDPLVFENALRPHRVASHVIVGRTGRGHSIAIYVSETTDPGFWQVHTAHRSRIASRLLREEGR